MTANLLLIHHPHRQGLLRHLPVVYLLLHSTLGERERERGMEEWRQERGAEGGMSGVRADEWKWSYIKDPINKREGNVKSMSSDERIVCSVHTETVRPT